MNEVAPMEVFPFDMLLLNGLRAMKNVPRAKDVNYSSDMWFIVWIHGISSLRVLEDTLLYIKSLRDSQSGALFWRLNPGGDKTTLRYSQSFIAPTFQLEIGSLSD